MTVQRAWRDLGALRSDDDYEALMGDETLRERITAVVRRIRRNARSRFCAMPGPVVLLFRSLRPSQLWLPTRTEQYNTGIAETRRLALNDGSRIALGAESGLKLAMNGRRRQVTMHPGEAYFEVSKHSGRPFLISAGGNRIGVVGTKFNVRYDASGARVSVAEGVVMVMPHSPSVFSASNGKAVSQGHEATVSPRADTVVVTHLGAVAPGAWRTGWLDYSDVPLSEIVSNLNRYLP
jgi:transmembrane sensor